MWPALIRLLIHNRPQIIGLRLGVVVVFLLRYLRAWFPFEDPKNYL